MEIPTLVAVAGAAALALLVVAIVVAVVTGSRQRRSRAHLEAMLLAAQQEADDLRRQLDELTRPPVVEPVDFVITQVGDQALDRPAAEDAVAVSDRLVLSATLGEPLVKVAAFSHGVRRALSPESRNRIWFEMRREVRASRRRRRALRKRLERDYRARVRAGEDLV
jgi:hypothetical protein